MATNVGTFGISSHGGALIESVEVTKRMSEKLVIDKNGTFGQAHAYDPVTSFSIRGRGDTGVVAGDSNAGLSAGVSGGKTIVTSVRKTENNDDFPSFEISGENYPAAN